MKLVNIAFNCGNLLGSRSLWVVEAVVSQRAQQSVLANITAGFPEAVARSVGPVSSNCSSHCLIIPEPSNV